MFLRPQKLKLINVVNHFPPGTLLEVGVGDGKYLPLYNIHDITGIDSSPGMLEIARRHIKRQTRLILMDGENLLFPDQSFDYVVLSHVLAVVDNPDRVLEEIHRVLKPSGRLFILNHSTPDNWLKYFDRAFQPVSKAFHFRSLFFIQDLPALKKFSLENERKFYCSYFRLLTLNKE